MNQLVGVWRLLSGKFAFDDGESVDMYGTGVTGRVVFTAEGWMSVIITGPGTETAQAAATPVMVAYSGRYRVEDGRWITQVDVASVPPWVGTEQVRDFEAKGDGLTVFLPMRALPNSPERLGQGSLVWKRED